MALIGRAEVRRSLWAVLVLFGRKTPMTQIVSESERLRRVERMTDIERALRQGTNVQQRSASREQRADKWCEWYRRRMEVGGGDPMQYMPDALAELEERIQDEVKGAIQALKAELRKALG